MLRRYSSVCFILEYCCDVWPFATNDESAPPALPDPIRQDTFAQGRQAQGFHLQQVTVGAYVVYLLAHRVGGHLGVPSNTHHLHTGLRWYRRSRHWSGRQGQADFTLPPEIDFRARPLKQCTMFNTAVQGVFARAMFNNAFLFERRCYSVTTFCLSELHQPTYSTLPLLVMYKPPVPCPSTVFPGRTFQFFRGSHASPRGAVYSRRHGDVPEGRSKVRSRRSRSYRSPRFDGMFLCSRGTHHLRSSIYNPGPPMYEGSCS